MLALVENANTSNISLVSEGNYRLSLPDGTQVSPVYAGWIGNNYRLCDFSVPAAPNYISSVSVGSNAGINYTNTNILTLSGGTYVGNVGQIQVNGTGSNGIVTSLIIANSGYYTSDPDSDNVPTGGTGSNLHVELAMSEYGVENQSYVYNANTNSVTGTYTYLTPEIDNSISLEHQRQASLNGDVNNTNLKDKLSNASAAQIDNWLINNVTDLASARVVLGAIVKFLANKYTHSLKK